MRPSRLQSPLRNAKEPVRDVARDDERAHEDAPRPREEREHEVEHIEQCCEIGGGRGKGAVGGEDGEGGFGGEVLCGDAEAGGEAVFVLRAEGGGGGISTGAWIKCKGEMRGIKVDVRSRILSRRRRKLSHACSGSQEGALASGCSASRGRTYELQPKINKDRNLTLGEKSG